MKKIKIYLIHATQHIPEYFKNQLQQLKIMLIERNYEIIEVEDSNQKIETLLFAAGLPVDYDQEKIHMRNDSFHTQLSKEIKAIENEHIEKIHKAIDTANILVAVVTIPEIQIGMQIMYGNKIPILIISESGRPEAMRKSAYVRNFGHINKHYRFQYYTDISQVVPWVDEIAKQYFTHLHKKNTPYEVE